MANRAILNHNGTAFEAEIAVHLHLNFPGAVILHDVWAYSESLANETQVDLIMITKKGMYFIEAKNWKKWVCGNYNDFYWKGIASGVDVMRVHNIVRQNMVHMRAVRNAMRRRGVEPVVAHNLIVFPDTTVLDTCVKEVIPFHCLVSTISRMERESVDCIDPYLYKKVIENVSGYTQHRIRKERLDDH